MYDIASLNSLNNNALRSILRGMNDFQPHVVRQGFTRAIHNMPKADLVDTILLLQSREGKANTSEPESKVKVENVKRVLLRGGDCLRNEHTVVFMNDPADAGADTGSIVVYQDLDDLNDNGHDDADKFFTTLADLKAVIAALEN